MDKIIIALASIVGIFLIAIIINSLIGGKKVEQKGGSNLLIEQSQKGVGAIEHNNASATVEECFIGAHKVLKEYNLELSMEKIVENGYSK